MAGSSPGVLKGLVTCESLFRVLLHEAADEVFGCEDNKRRGQLGATGRVINQSDDS